MTIGQLIDMVRDRYPDWRYGQIIANAVLAVKPETIATDPFYVEDSLLREGLWKLLA
jgi:hypothetical protein